MQIEKFDGGFTTNYQNHIVDKVVSYYEKTCVIHYADGSQRTVEFTGKDEVSSYNAQYGIPVSVDGSKLFLSCWYNGLAAFDIATNAVLWRYKRSRIRNAIIYPDYLVAQRANESIIKFDVETGEELGMVNSGTIEWLFPLFGRYVLVCNYRGKPSVVDTENMMVVKQYPKNLVNPFDCIYFNVVGAELKGDKMIIHGFEQYPQRPVGPEFKIAQRVFNPFEREVDFDLPE